MKKTMYLLNNGLLQRHCNTIRFCTAANGTRYLPVAEISELSVHGEITLNKRFLEFAGHNGIPIHFYNHYGWYIGTFYPREHHASGTVLLAQVQHYLDPSLRLVIARQIVLGAVANMRQVLKYYDNRGKDLRSVIEQLEDTVGQTDDVHDVNDLMLVEARLRQIYYSAFDIILADHPEFAFGQRTRRPPGNRLNALISFGNSVLYTAILKEIYATEIDPRVGYLHATNFRRFSLNLDLSEIFKPLLVDRVIISLIDQAMIKPHDFEKVGDGIFLSEKGRKLWLEEFEKRLRTTFRHRTLRREVSYRRLIRLEVYKLEKHLLGAQPYEPFVSLW